MAAVFKIGTAVLPCMVCGGDGRVSKSRYGSDDPYARDAVECEPCGGTGNQTCEDCGKHPAVSTFAGHLGTYRLCKACHDEWLSEEAA